MAGQAAADGSEASSLLQFVPFVSRLEAGFWHELGKRKLEKYKLSEEARDVHGYYSNSTFPRLATWHACTVRIYTGTLVI